MSLIEFYNYRVVSQYLPEFAWGLWATLWISFVCLVGSLILGTLVTVARRSQKKWISLPVTAYVEAVRSTPLLVQLYLVYYGLSQIPVLNVPVPALACGIFALTVHTGAYMSEIIRGGIEAVDRGQFEGAKAVGMTERQTMINVIYPQAFAKVIPSLLGQAAVLVKDSSILSFIAVFELLGAGLIILSDRVMPTEAFMTAAFGYLLIYLMMLVASNKIQKKLAGNAWKSR
ncbi:amino acid ABC transporter permease [uncultured Roseobacter sp.]|uniref:amino acid ABC transporter permease n=1 Tax=uncultured Roseobacter sp. TaxID=114847 RepID=UPI00260E2BE5|nr:amino acid ABC transporter permease [uncultured Roseobacter sp.]